jgi:hypothetical protein
MNGWFEQGGERWPPNIATQQELPDLRPITLHEGIKTYIIYLPNHWPTDNFPCHKRGETMLLHSYLMSRGLPRTTSSSELIEIATSRHEIRGHIPPHICAGDELQCPELNEMNWYKLALKNLADDDPAVLVASRTIVFGPKKKKPVLPALTPTGPRSPDPSPPTPPAPVPSTTAPAAGKAYKRWQPPSRSKS